MLIMYENKWSVGLHQRNVLKIVPYNFIGICIRYVVKKSTNGFLQDKYCMNVKSYSLMLSMATYGTAGKSHYRLSKCIL